MMAGDTPRIPPLPPREWPEEMRAAMAALVPEHPRHPLTRQDADRPKGRNALGLLAQHPELARAYHTLNGHVLFATTLTLRQRELLILRIAAVRDAEYEWKQHVVQAGDVGITPDEVARVADGPDAQGWSLLEGAMMRAVDELIAGADISDDTYGVLAAELDERQLMDLVFTVGAYDLLAMAFRTFRVQVDADLDAWLDKAAEG
jgi:alkylhydroperoxidase family enzyme